MRGEAGRVPRRGGGEPPVGSCAREGAPRWRAPGGEGEGPFVCGAFAGKGQTRPRLPPAVCGIGGGGAEVTRVLPLRRFNLQHYLRRFSTSGDRRKTGALSERPAEFRFLNPRAATPAASPVQLCPARTVSAAFRARRCVRGAESRLQPAAHKAARGLLPASLSLGAGRPGQLGGSGRAQGPRVPAAAAPAAGRKPTASTEADGPGLFLCARGARFIAKSMPTHKRLEKTESWILTREKCLSCAHQRLNEGGFRNS